MSLGSFELRPAIRGAVSLSKGQYKPMAQDQGKTVSVDICDASPPSRFSATPESSWPSSST
ncbi:MAG: hypothetical protein MZV70_43420 [Desulfobacterales bacterium]|nr:hypothetical protein [Desulfobacterales bacterium]